jgi:hypothetical protein
MSTFYRDTFHLVDTSDLNTNTQNTNTLNSKPLYCVLTSSLHFSFASLFDRYFPLYSHDITL